MDDEPRQLPIFIDEPNEPETLPKILLIAGGAIGLIIIICIVLTSMLKTPSISKIDMPGESALAKPKGEVAGAQTKEVYGAEKPPKTTPTPSTSSGPTASPTDTASNAASPTSAPAGDSPTATPAPTNKPADPTNTPEPTATPTPTETPSPTQEPTTTPAP